MQTDQKSGKWIRKVKNVIKHSLRRTYPIWMTNLLYSTKTPSYGSSFDCSSVLVIGLQQGETIGRQWSQAKLAAQRT